MKRVLVIKELYTVLIRAFFRKSREGHLFAVYSFFISAHYSFASIIQLNRRSKQHGCLLEPTFKKIRTDASDSLFGNRYSEIVSLLTFAVSHFTFHVFRFTLLATHLKQKLCLHGSKKSRNIEMLVNYKKSKLLGQLCSKIETRGNRHAVFVEHASACPIAA